MKLSELIAHVGDENVKVQPLNGCLEKAHTSKGVGHITFTTEADIVHEMALSSSGTKMVGLILWLPRERLPGQKQNSELTGAQRPVE